MSKKILLLTMHESLPLFHIGFTIIRIGFGITFLIFGYKKLLSGSDNLIKVGSAMSLFGITYGYILWGYLAALTELLAGLTFIVGFCTRIASIPLAWLLIVALRFHLHNNDPFRSWALVFIGLSITFAFLIAGSGIYSIDNIINYMIKPTDKYPYNSA